LQYFGQGTDTPIKTLAQARSILSEVEAITDIRAAFIYVSFVPASVASQSVADNKSDELELLLVTSQGRAIRKRIAGSTRSQVIRVVRDFQSKVTSSRSTNYLNSAKQLYRWLVTPLEADLQAADIQNLVFIMDKNLRSIPLAALHSGQEFLVEKYSISLMPSLTLTDSQHRDIRGYQVLAMGASQFTEQNPLPAVPRGIPLPEALSNLGDKQLMHPYYWAAFTLIGNPW
jgi:CHAT domain-containing protein